MYGASWCPHCARLRGELKEEGLAYIEIDVEQSGSKEQMSQTLEISGYPLVYVGYRRVEGNSIAAVKEALIKGH